MSIRVLLFLALLAPGAIAAPKEWSNTTETPTEIDVSPSPKKPVVLELGNDGRPLRALAFTETKSGITVSVPPGAKVQLWSRSELAGAKDEVYATAARYGAFPRINIGPILVDRVTDPLHPTQSAAWEKVPARFRAYPEGPLPISVSVRNDGSTSWKSPRVRLFAPDDWVISPAVAPLVTGAGKPLGSLAPGASALAAFTVRIPGSTLQGAPIPVVAFLRFTAAGAPVTVQNNVVVTIEDPVDRHYAMTEKGDAFIVRLTNHFAPSAIGTAFVEVRKPAGSTWTVTKPDSVDVKDDVDAKAPIAGLEPPTKQLAVPVVVTLNGYRMGYTPVVCAVAEYDVPDGESGLKRLPYGSSPTALSPDGLSFAAPGATEQFLSLDVPEKFAVADPSVFVSPTWVTVDLTSDGAKRIRLEYDAWNATKPSVAGDMPISVAAGAEETFSFLIPDARFTNSLPGGADLRLGISGGNAKIKKISVTKWNPLKAN